MSVVSEINNSDYLKCCGGVCYFVNLVIVFYNLVFVFFYGWLFLDWVKFGLNYLI